MQEVARSRVVGHNAAGLVVESRARRQETKLDKESKVKNITKSNYSGVERQGETKAVVVYE